MATRIVGLKNVTLNEPYLAHHGEGGKVTMPGLMIIEALAQTGATLVMTLGGRSVEEEHSFHNARRH